MSYCKKIFMFGLCLALFCGMTISADEQTPKLEEYNIEFSRQFNTAGPLLHLLAAVVHNETLYAIIELDNSAEVSAPVITTRTVSETVKAPKGLSVVNVLYDPTKFYEIKPGDGLSENGRLAFHLIQSQKQLVMNYIIGTEPVWMNQNIVRHNDFGNHALDGADFTLTTSLFIIGERLTIGRLQFKGGFAGQTKALYLLIDKSNGNPTLISYNQATPGASATKEILVMTSPFTAHYTMADGGKLSGELTATGAKMVSIIAGLGVLHVYARTGLDVFTDDSTALMMQLMDVSFEDCIGVSAEDKNAKKNPKDSKTK